jgi:hypothetical protein
MVEEAHWATMKKQIQECKKISKAEATELLYTHKSHSPDPLVFRSPLKQGSRPLSLDGKHFKSSRQAKLHAKYMVNKKSFVKAADDFE